MSTRPSESRARFQSVLRPSIAPAPTEDPQRATAGRSRFITTLTAEQHQELRVLAVHERLDASAIVWGAVDLITTDPGIRARVLDAARRRPW